MSVKVIEKVERVTEYDDANVTRVGAGEGAIGNSMLLLGANETIRNAEDAEAIYLFFYKHLPGGTFDNLKRIISQRYGSDE